MPRRCRHRRRSRERAAGWRRRAPPSSGGPSRRAPARPDVAALRGRGGQVIAEVKRGSPRAGRSAGLDPAEPRALRRGGRRRALGGHRARFSSAAPRAPGRGAGERPGADAAQGLRGRPLPAPGGARGRGRRGPADRAALSARSWRPAASAAEAGLGPGRGPRRRRGRACARRGARWSGSTTATCGPSGWTSRARSIGRASRPGVAVAESGIAHAARTSAGSAPPASTPSSSARPVVRARPGRVLRAMLDARSCEMTALRQDLRHHPAADAMLAAGLGADVLGFNFWPRARVGRPPGAGDLPRGARPSCARSGSS